MYSSTKHDERTSPVSVHIISIHDAIRWNVPHRQNLSVAQHTQQRFELFREIGWT
jgi:hypothetical protein